MDDFSYIIDDDGQYYLSYGWPSMMFIRIGENLDYFAKKLTIFCLIVNCTYFTMEKHRAQEVSIISINFELLKIFNAYAY